MKKIIVTILAVIVLGGGAWYYFTEWHTIPIGNIINNPREYAGRDITISGTVTDRFSFFGIKYFDIQDSSGKITVVTKKPLPAKGIKVRVKGHVEDGFSIGDQQALVLVENQPE